MIESCPRWSACQAGRRRAARRRKAPHGPSMATRGMNPLVRKHIKNNIGPKSCSKRAVETRRVAWVARFWRDQRRSGLVGPSARGADALRLRPLPSSFSHGVGAGGRMKHRDARRPLPGTHSIRAPGRAVRRSNCGRNHVGACVGCAGSMRLLVGCGRMGPRSHRIRLARRQKCGRGPPKFSRSRPKIGRNDATQTDPELAGGSQIEASTKKRSVEVTGMVVSRRNSHGQDASGEDSPASVEEKNKNNSERSERYASYSTTALLSDFRAMTAQFWIV